MTQNWCFMIIFSFYVAPYTSTNQENEFCVNKDLCNSNNVNQDSILEVEKSHLKYLNLVSEAKRLFVPDSRNNCSCYFNTLNKDLGIFKEGISQNDLNKIRNRGTTYVINNHKLFRSNECSFPARCSGVEYFLKSLLPKLPDMEFVLNVRDWPQISKHFEPQGPVFSFSKTNEYLDIQYPAWAFWEGGPAIKSYPKGIGRWDLMRNTLLEENKKWPWEKKNDKAFFRGSRTSDERDAVVLLSRTHPTLIDAHYTKNQAWKSMADTLNEEPASEVPLAEHCRYRYLLNMRGVAASFRFKHLFLCGSLVIHFGDDWTEFFYDALKPWIHYIPMPANSSQQEIMELLHFLRDHDDISKEIAERGYHFIRDNLTMKSVKCYWRNLLKRYSKLIKFTAKVDSNMMEIRYI